MEEAELPPGDVENRFGAEDLDALTAAAVLEPVFSLRDLAAVIGRPAAERAFAVGVFAERQGGCRFTDEGMREALLARVPADLLAERHLETARALRKAGARRDAVARHFLAGARPGDDEAIWIAMDAIDDIDVAGERAQLLEAAIALMGPLDPRRTRARAALADASLAIGAWEVAEDLAHTVLVDPAGAPYRASMRVVVAIAKHARGLHEDAVAVLTEWLADATLDDAERARLTAALAQVRAQSDRLDLTETVALAEQAVALADEIGDPALQVHALSALQMCIGRADPARAIAAAERALTVAQALPDHGAAHRVHLALGALLQGTGFNVAEADRAEALFREALRLAEAFGRSADVPLCLSALATIEFMRDRWDDAVANAEAAQQAAREVGAPEESMRALLAHVAIVRGDFDRAERLVREEETLSATRGFGQDDVAQLHRSMLFEARGDLRTAFDVRWRWFQGRAPAVAVRRWWRCVWFGLVLGERDRVAEVVEALERSGAHGDDAILARALLENDRATVSRIFAADDIAPRNVEIAERAAVSLALVGLPDEAARFVRLLEQHYERVNGHPWFDQLLRHLGTYGVTYRRRRRAGQSRTGWDAITPTEHRVMHLAAEGLTNKEIGERLLISPRTVQTHLAHVFEKLGLSSRVELAAAVGRRARDD